jgi:hypothetical protein
MTRVCVFGDSHIAALKAGWTSIANEFQGTELVFFGASRQRMEDIALEDNALVATSKPLRILFERTSGGLSRVANDFDAYILCGLGAAAQNVLPIVSVYSSEGQPLRKGIPLSDACYRACLLGIMLETVMVGILAKFRQLTCAPIVVLAAPLPKPRPFFGALASTGEDRIVAEFFISVLAEIAEKHGARFMPQPRETLQKSALTTNPGYFQGAVRLFEGPDDQTHANADYGAIVLRAALRGCAITEQLSVNAGTSLTRC